MKRALCYLTGMVLCAAASAGAGGAAGGERRSAFGVRRSAFGVGVSETPTDRRLLTGAFASPTSRAPSPSPIEERGALEPEPPFPNAERRTPNAERRADLDPGGLELAKVLRRARKTAGYGSFQSRADGVLVEGDVDLYGLDHTFRLWLTPGDRFRITVEGRAGETYAFDGQRGWAVDWSGMPRVLELEELELYQVLSAVLSGQWLAEESPFEREIRSLSDGQGAVLRVKLKTGRLPYQLLLDPETDLPSELRSAAPGVSPVVFQFRDYRDAAGCAVPRTFTRTSGGITHTYRVRKVTPGPRDEPDPFAPRLTPPDETTFDGLEARVRIRVSETGHLLVRPRINGREVGWFLLDSGSAATAISPGAAAAAGLSPFGRSSATGVAGTVRTTLTQPREFRLGPLVIRRPILVQLDLKGLSRHLKTPVDGVCGYDLFARCVVVLDAAAGAIEIYDPKQYRLERGAWQEMYLSGKLPCVTGQFEGNHQDLFMVDTGSTGTVSFEPRVVRRLNLLESRPTRVILQQGIGGTVEGRTGELDWFELGGKRFQPVAAQFRTAVEGTPSTAFYAGYVGLEILRSFRVVFNYPLKEIALLPPDRAQPR